MGEINKKTLNRLRQLLAMMGSDNAPERETARRKLDELLQKNRKTWNDLIELLQAGGVSDSAWNVGDDDRPDDDSEQTTDIGIPKEQVEEPDALELAHFILQEYVDLKPHEYVATALWILHTHQFQHFMISPRLALTCFLAATLRGGS